MKMKVLKIFLICLICYGCSSKATTKLTANDPFISTMVESEFKEIDASVDNIIEGKQGTVILIPGGSLQLNGSVFKGKAKIELAEALDKKDMLLSNLTTMSNGKPLESGGMIYLNAYSGESELSINPSKPIEVQVPATEIKPGMKLYNGLRDAEGNMNWTDPKPLQTFLTPVPLSDLDFLPEKFADAVKDAIPYKGHQEATEVLTDSLYYALSAYTSATPVMQAINMNEAWYGQRKIENGKYTDNSYDLKSLGKSIAVNDTVNSNNCGIDPAMIMVLKSEKFENTLIATRAFEARLKVLFKICRNDLLKLYVDNLDKEIWVIDEMVMNMLGKGHSFYDDFENFASQKLTKVRQDDNHAQILKEYFTHRLEKTKAELKSAELKSQAAIAKQNKEAEKLKSEYRKLLWKREKYRMEAYNLEWTEMGWKNIDREIFAEKCQPKKIEVTIDNSVNFDRVYTYVVFTGIKSLFRMNTDDNHVFYTGGSNTNRYMEMQCEPDIQIVGIGYKGDQVFIAQHRQTIIQTETTCNLTLILSSKEALELILGSTSEYQKAKELYVDLEYQRRIFEENKQLVALNAEIELMQRLYDIAYPCCFDINGEELFNQNCASCHSILNKGTAPALKGVTSRYSRKWLIAFTKNNEKMRMAGDTDAIAVYNENGMAGMTVFENLSSREINAIYDWIEKKGRD